MTTKNDNTTAPTLETETWEEFFLGGLFEVKYGVNLELNKCMESDKGIAFVSRTGENNGVSARVEEVEGVEPQRAGLVTVAGGGSVLATFFQNEPFYSGRDLFILEIKGRISLATKLFLITIIKSNKFKYNYGRQANNTIPDIVLRLPIKRGADNMPIIDRSCKYSAKGYVPDWEYMEEYIKALPYGDKI